MFYDVKSSDTKQAMLSNIMQYLKKCPLLSMFSPSISQKPGEKGVTS